MKRWWPVAALLVLSACSGGGSNSAPTSPTVTSVVAAADGRPCRDAATAVIAAGELNKPPPKIIFDGGGFPAPGSPDRGLVEASLIECGTRARLMHAFADGGVRRGKVYLGHLYELGCVLIRQDRISALPDDCPSS